MDDALSANRANWDERAPLHAGSPEYAVERFLADPAFLSAVVAFDRPRLGSIAGLDAIHLQCHIGTDTVSLARLGARMTGLDFSPASLAQARWLGERTATPIRWIESAVDAAPEALGGAGFDLVYTGIGALCWLPDIAAWARVVAALLRPGGRLFLRDMHPMLAALEVRDGAIRLDYPYFERREASVFDDGTTYVAGDARLRAAVTHEWSHGLGEIVTALLAAGLELTALTEHESVPWEALPGLMTCDERGEWRLAERAWRLAASFTLEARARA